MIGFFYIKVTECVLEWSVPQNRYGSPLQCRKGIKISYDRKKLQTPKKKSLLKRLPIIYFSIF